MAFKLAICLALVCALSLSVVESCNSNTGTASACSSGALGSACSESCPCASNSSLSCIDGICACKGTGSWSDACSSDCECNAQLGLVCDGGVCECKNKTGDIWDGECFPLTTVICNAPAGSLFVDDGKAKEWRCVYDTLTLYSPLYDGLSKTGRYRIQGWGGSKSAFDGRTKCSGVSSEIIFNRPDDIISKWFEAFAPGPTWTGITLDSKDNKYYYDSGDEFTGVFSNPDDTFACVSVVGAGDGTVTFTKEDCTTTYTVICGNY